MAGGWRTAAEAMGRAGFLASATLCAAGWPVPSLLADCTIACDAPTILEGFEVGNVDGDTGSFCSQLGRTCGKPVLREVSYTLDDPSCDPHGPTPCAVTAESEWLFPTNGSGSCFQGISIKAGWLITSVAQCGLSTSGTLDTDVGVARVHFDASCGDPPGWVLRAIMCQGSPCIQETQLLLDFSSSALCNPRPTGCGGGDPGAGLCCFGPGGATSPDGSPPGFALPGTNARFVYQAGGVGHPGSPGAGDWIGVSGLGRYWVHEYATRLVGVDDPALVWLITPGGTFRRFVDAAEDGFYEEAAPSDEDRTLERDSLTGGWTLTALDGTVTVFGADGSWQSTSDRLGNTWEATYAGGLLDRVAFPDGRQEVFDYVGGRLATIEQIGLEDDGTQAPGSPADCTSPSECRTWSFTWNGDDLQRIDYPDGTARELFYGAASLPGYLTRRDLVGTDGTSRRVEAAWDYTAGGRLLRTWRGATSFADGVDRYEFNSYDDETRPTEVEVTDSFGLTATYTLGYDDDGVAPRLIEVSGQCPSCGGPDERYEYDDPAHPLRPTARIDGNGPRTEWTYNPNGTVASRIEAAGTLDERIVSFEYDTAFPGLLIGEERPSTNGVGLRDTSWTYHPTSGVLESMIVSGDEDTYDAEGDGIVEGAFTLTTTYGGHNAAGQPGEVDPPGFGVADLTAFTYDVPGRNGLLPDSRTDPLIGATLFGYDGLNRRTSVVDPNGVETRTAYDPLDRVDEVIEAADTVDALTTQVLYDAFGDLEAVVHPRGNVTAYGYDAAGRLEEVRRQAGAELAAGDERTFYTLNRFGQRVREDEQVWDGAAWQTAGTTGYAYSSRCHLDAVVHAGGSVTEYDYDCDGNLTAVWDANHPSASGTAAPTRVYVYDTLDRLDEVREPWVAGTDCRGVAAPAGCAVTSYGYDVQDHLVSVTDAEGNQTTYTYSDRGLLTAELSPVSGTTTHRYDDHGELVRTTDARGVTIARTVDVLDRVTAVSYPDSALATVFAYDVAPAACAGTSFPVGRLASIGRHGESVDFCYDAHGRPTRDGALTYGYDANGNRTRIGHPGDVEAIYGYDFADRPVTLAVVTPHSAAPGTAVVSSASYLPSGPLTGLGLGNGTSEARTFDGRYFPDTIVLTAPTSRTWTYTTDDLGNVTDIVESRDCADLELTGETVATTVTETACGRLLAGPDYTIAATGDLTLRASTQIVLRNGIAVAAGGRLSAGIDATLAEATRTFEYRDVSYFLTAASGDWGSLSWTYDRIGNRLTETRDGNVDTYTYATNGTCDPLVASCNTPLLTDVSGPVFGSRSFHHGAAGHLEEVHRGANVIHLDPDDEGRAAEARRTDDTGTTTFATAAFTYEGRSFLLEATDPATGGFVEPLYGTEGLLHALSRRDSSTDPTTTHHLFHFAGRPVAQLVSGATADTWWYLTTDHLGTPIVATDGAGEEIWVGPLEPFGHDPRAGLPAGALESGVFLRFPGQWEDETWQDATMGAGVYYNVHRWYSPGTGRYSRPDPLGEQVNPNRYYYAAANPSLYVDPLGLLCQLTPQWRDCLSKIFGFPVQQIEVHNHSALPFLFTGNATFTLPGKILLPGKCSDFWGDPWLVLHEYYHVIDQWDTGRMTLGGYLWEGGRQIPMGRDPHADNRFEQQANFFADTHQESFEDCLGCTAMPPNSPPPPPVLSPCPSGVTGRTRGMLPAHCR